MDEKQRIEREMEPTIEGILSAFEALCYGHYDLDIPLQRRVLDIFEAEPRGFTASEMVEAVLGRELTIEEDRLVCLRTEETEGCA
jgi:hypothetical protein